jgi:4-amino-4-deoxy-L-arabinose transferase-like glycosyltransferase
MEEPSVLDFVKSKILFWRKEKIHIPPLDFEYPTEGLDREIIVPAPPTVDPEMPMNERATPELPGKRVIFPPGSGWIITRVLGTLFLAFLAQRALEPPGRSVISGVVLYILAVIWLVWSNLKGEWRVSGFKENSHKPMPLSIRPIGLWLSIIFCTFAFFMFGGNLFTKVNLTVWAFGFIAFLYSFWLPDGQVSPWWQRIRSSWNRLTTNGISFSPWTLTVIAVFGLAAFYRLYLLNLVPGEMFSDHAEKLLDVGNLLKGETNIFFPNNTGREAFQMYLTATVSLLFNTGLSFLSLKLGTALCGIFTLPFIYLLGKEISNRRVGLWAMFFAGIAYWPNVISRVALRFTLYPTFTASMLYFLIRGLKRQNRNDFIISGIFLGLGMHGYSPYRFVPIIVVVTVLLYSAHQKSLEIRRGTLFGLLMVTFSSLIVFLPLLRYAISNPTTFSYRMMTRMGEAERAFPGPPVQIFFENLWKALVMPVWDNGQIWVHSIPFRPALGIVAAVFFVLGIVLILIRYLKERNWLDLFLMISIPLLMMPSVLSLAFPDENPSLNRTGGALVIIFLIVGIAFDSMITTLKSSKLSPGGSWFAWGLGGILLFWSATQNYDLVFNQYAQQFLTNAWNTSEMGAVIRQFADSSGSEDSAWVIPYPHWVDTRLVGIRAGFPERDYALWQENITDTTDDARAKLYLIKPEDTDTIDLLREYYPTGVLRLYVSKSPGRDFYMYSVPPTE